MPADNHGAFNTFQDAITAARMAGEARAEIDNLRRDVTEVKADVKMLLANQNRALGIIGVMSFSVSLGVTIVLKVFVH